MTINVTQEDIDKGHKANACKCPISRAVKRRTRLAEVYVCGTSICAFRVNGGEAFDVPCPKSVADFQMDFDAGRPVFPFSFELEGAVESKSAA